MEGRSGRVKLASESQLFRPYQAVGFICDQVPFDLHYGGSHDSLITTSIGRSYHQYRLSDLRMVFNSRRQERKIGAIACWETVVFTTSGPHIECWSRGHLLRTIKGHMDTVYILYIFGKTMISISKDRCMKIWQLEGTISAPQVNLCGSIELSEKFTPTCVLHPHTYLNKIILGSEEGVMQLWNIRSEKLIYEFASCGSPIVCFDQSPALDVIGVGLRDGRVLVKNIRTDKMIAQFLHSEGGAITTLSFRADKRQATLVTGNSSGQIAVWDLEQKKLAAIMNDVHDGSICRAQFVPNEPLLITSGTDNALRIWIFDQSDGSARILRLRSGHYEPPTRIRFYKDRRFLLSAGEDKTLRKFNIQQAQQNVELSQGKIQSRARKTKVKAEDLKLPVVTQFAVCETRERDWDNIVTIHRDDNFAHTWNWQNNRLGKHRMGSAARGQTLPVTATDISHCGNYCFIGNVKGQVLKFNIQSGLLRCTTETPGEMHFESVTSIACDLLNMNVLSGSLDGTVKIWSFEHLKLRDTLEIGSPIIQLLLQKENNILVVVCEDLSIRLYDLETKKLVRRFNGHTNQITDVAFSHDSRWLISSGLDCTIRVWDIVTGKMIDWFRTETPVISLTFSPTGEYLATAQLGIVGIFLWANKNFFTTVFLQPPSDSPALLNLPTVVASAEKGDDDESDDDDSDSDDESSDSSDDSSSSEEDSEEPAAKRKKIEQEAELPNIPLKLSSDLVTLSSVPRDRIKTIVNLEQIKARNKPKEAPKAPKAAPFFLPSTSEVHPTFIPLQDEEDSTQEKGSRILNFGKMNTETAFMRLLQQPDKYMQALDMLTNMTPSNIDFEVRQLTFAPQIKPLFDFIEFGLQEHLCFELLQALLNVTLKIHSEEITSNSELSKQSMRIQSLQSEVWERLENMFHYNQCLISHLSGLQI